MKITHCLFAFALAVVLTGCGKLKVQPMGTDALDPLNLADTEPSIAVNPLDRKQIAVVAFSENWSAAAGAPVWKSDDRGKTWRKVFQIPQPAAGMNGPGDQKIDFDADGKLYIAELGSGFSGLGNFVFRQTGGADDPLTVGALYGDDQPHLSVDASPASPRKGTLYSPWLDFSVAFQRSTVSWSTDQGVTMNDVGAGDNSAFSNRTTRIAVAPDGRAFIVYKVRQGTAGAPAGFENVEFRVNRTDDGGVTWNALGATGVTVHAATVQTFFTNTFGNIAKGKVARARSSDAWIAVDPGNGDVYVTYVSRDASGFGQIFLARSTDDGTTWTSSRVTDGTHHSAYPEVAVTKRGIVGVLYIDFDDAGPATLFRHRFARSFNRGGSFSDKVLQTMDPAPLTNAASGFLWGDYEGITAAKNTFYGVFTGEGSGRSTPQLDPVFFRQKSCRWWSLSCWFEGE
jgi:hypothetical protein